MSGERLNPYIHERWQQLNSLVISTIDTGLKYLFAVSGGGCVAVLTFIGTSANADIFWLKVALGFFFFALLLVGLLNILRFWYINQLLEQWRANTGKLRAKQITENQMKVEDDQLVHKSDWLPILAYVAFASIIIAGFAGAMSFISY